MAPARQRFDADDLVGARVELRLEIGNELAALQAAHDVVGGLFGVHDLRLQRLGVELEPIAAQTLGAIEREIGVDEQPLPVDRAAEGAGDADAHAEAALVAFVEDRLAGALDHPARKRVEAGHAGVGMADDDEFVAAGARDEIAFAQIAADDLGGVDQHRVARGMAERVVDLLEAVEIDLQQARRRRPSPRSARRAPRARARDTCGWAGGSGNRAANCTRCARAPPRVRRCAPRSAPSSAVRSSVKATSAVTSQLTPTILHGAVGREIDFADRADRPAPPVAER